MDRDRITAELAKPLDSALVKPPPPGKYGEYISAFDVLTAANRIFGWDGWTYKVNRLEQTNCDPNQGKNSDQWAIGYMAVVTATIADENCQFGEGATRQDVGHGQGHSKSLGDAHDSAMKEAVTDALKRALRTFGNPMGLALYDKTKAHVSDDPGAAERANDIAAIEKSKIGTITDIDELGAYWDALNAMQKHIAKRPDVIAAKDERKAVIGGKDAA